MSKHNKNANRYRHARKPRTSKKLASSRATRDSPRLRLLWLAPSILAVVVIGVLLISSPLQGVHRGRGLFKLSTSSSNGSGSAANSNGQLCPLTGTPAPGGSVPLRPALAIKIGNNPSARPQSGLSKADIVFEVPIEGAITRLIAIFQCQGFDKVGPVRSTRWVDLQLLEQLGHPIFGFAGGINPDRALIASSPLFDADFFRYYDLYYRDNLQYAPNNLYVATSSLWKLDSSTSPPPQLFAYSTKTPSGGSNVTDKISSATLRYSSILTVNWQWQSSSRRWLRYYGTSPADGASGVQISAANVVIERVNTVPGPYSEDSEGALGVHSITVGKGPAVVLRNGVAIHGYWQRSSIGQITRFTTISGQTIPLSPGNTWVELVPNSSSSNVVLNSGTANSGTANSGTANSGTANSGTGQANSN